MKYEQEFEVRPLTPIEKAVREYHRLTELYDRTLPHYSAVDYEVQPLPGAPMALSNRYARDVRRRLMTEGRFSYLEWVSANSRYIMSREFVHDMMRLP